MEALRQQGTPYRHVRLGSQKEVGEMTNAFFIGWIDREDGRAANRRGRIVAADLDEVFDAPLEVWSAADYENQWRDGFSRLVAGAERSTLVTRLMRGRGSSFGGEQWTLYRAGACTGPRN